MEPTQDKPATQDAPPVTVAPIQFDLNNPQPQQRRTQPTRITLTSEMAEKDEPIVHGLPSTAPSYVTNPRVPTNGDIVGRNFTDNDRYRGVIVTESSEPGDVDFAIRPRGGSVRAVTRLHF